MDVYDLVEIIRNEQKSEEKPREKNTFLTKKISPKVYLIFIVIISFFNDINDSVAGLSFIQNRKPIVQSKHYQL